MNEQKKESVLKLEGLSKKFDGKIVVDHISLEIEQGEIFGLLGPNGAGKSTTMNMICSLLKPTGGDVKLFGMEANKQGKEIKRRIGYIPQELAIHGNLKAWENVELLILDALILLAGVIMTRKNNNSEIEKNC